MAENAPIAVFAYNRKDRLERLLSSLQICAEFASTPVTIFVDGPRNSKDVLAVNQVQDFVRSLRFSNVEHKFATKNHGLRASITSGVQTLVLQYGRVITLEDDLEVSADLLTYFNAALLKYERAAQIWAVCSDTPEVPALRDHKQALFLPVANSCGWATWARAWQHFTTKPALSPATMSSRTFRTRFGVHGLRDYPSLLRAAETGRVDSWFIYWALALTMHNALSVFPPRPLVRNTGLAAGTHGSSLNPFALFPLNKTLGSFDFTLPDNPMVNFAALDQLIQSREARQYRLTQSLGSVKRALYALVGR